MATSVIAYDEEKKLDKSLALLAFRLRQQTAMTTVRPRPQTTDPLRKRLS
jgi:hypothetical protein